METKHKLETKGFELSTDYNLLWDLIQSGQRVPAWLVYSDDRENPIWDIVEVKYRSEYGYYDIGCRGISYSGFYKTVPEFVQNCAQYSLHFVKPSN